MWTPAILTAALALGQPGVELPNAAPVNLPPLQAAAPESLGLISASDQPPAGPPVPAKPVEAPIAITAPLLPTPKPAAPAAPTATAPAAVPPPRWFLMKELQGTFLGSELDGNGVAVYGWAEMSGTASSAKVSNEPMSWNDRANRVLLQQVMIRMEKLPVTTGTTTPTWGFRTDWLLGSDYRFTLPRGIFNSQVINSNIDPNTGVPTQNLYGIDPVDFYGELYIPNVQQGLDIKVGRFYAPYGEESLEAVSAPLVSRSYEFNNVPLTNVGVLATLTIDPEWTVCGGYVIGNDIFFDAGMEGRFTGYVKWTQPSGGRNTVTVATSLGRGVFNPNAKFAEEAPGEVTTTGILSFETAGRNNINIMDVLYTHTFNPVLSYAAEGVYGWQYEVDPALLPGRSGPGTAVWGGVAQYLIYVVSARTTATARLDLFDDPQGYRTAAKGLYEAVTGGVAVKLRPGLIVRPELRWDHNGSSRAFDVPYNDGTGVHDLFTAACDVIVRW